MCAAVLGGAHATSLAQRGRLCTAATRAAAVTAALAALLPQSPCRRRRRRRPACSPQLAGLMAAACGCLPGGARCAAPSGRAAAAGGGSCPLARPGHGGGSCAAATCGCRMDGAHRAPPLAVPLLLAATSASLPAPATGGAAAACGGRVGSVRRAACPGRAAAFARSGRLLARSGHAGGLSRRCCLRPPCWQRSRCRARRPCCCRCRRRRSPACSPWPQRGFLRRCRLRRPREQRSLRCVPSDHAIAVRGDVRVSLLPSSRRAATAGAYGGRVSDARRVARLLLCCCGGLYARCLSRPC